MKPLQRFDIIKTEIDKHLSSSMLPTIYTTTKMGENTLKCYTLDVREFIFHSLKIFNSSLFQLICANDEMGLMSRMNSYIKTLC
jgi:hypothetical protein